MFSWFFFFFLSVPAKFLASANPNNFNCTVIIKLIKLCSDVRKHAANILKRQGNAVKIFFVV